MHIAYLYLIKQRNLGGGAAALRAERAGGRAMNHTHACRTTKHNDHQVTLTVEQLLWKANKEGASPVLSRSGVTRLCEVAAQGGSLTAFLSWAPRPSRIRNCLELRIGEE